MSEMRTSVGVALVLASVLGVRAQARGDVGPGPPDGGTSLLAVPSASGTKPTESARESSGLPPPRALDSKRTPMPDRLANDHWLQYFPMAPPTPPIPEGTGASGSGATRVNRIKDSTGGAPPDIPRDSVTRTPEDQLAPASPAEAP